jgi:4-alpha-glucanotransferase
VLGLPGDQRMNRPGTVGAHNWSWRFGWDALGDEPARVLAVMAEVSGRVAAR